MLVKLLNINYRLYNFYGLIYMFIKYLINKFNLYYIIIHFSIILLYLRRTFEGSHEGEKL